MRLANLSNVMALRLFSSAVAKRFPTYRHLVLVCPPLLHLQAGLLTEEELQRLLALEELVAKERHQEPPDVDHLQPPD